MSTTRDKTYVTWTPEMDRTLSNILLEEHGKGHKTPNGWKGVAFTAAIRGMADAHNIVFTKEKLMARLKTWNKYYKEVSKILETSGIGWDWERNTIRIDGEEVWANFLKEHPTYRHYRDKVIINWSDLGVLCGHDQARGSEAMTANESVQDYNVYSPTEDNPAPAETSAAASSGHRKRKPNQAETLANAIQCMSSTISEAFATLRDVANSRLPPLHNTQLYEVLGRLDDLSERQLLMAMDLLGSNREKFDTFMALPDRLKIQWLHIQLYGNHDF